MRRTATLSLCLATLAFLAGCGGENGPARYRVSGTVEFESQPVPSGTIVFEPDASQGNDGPQGYAQIHDGRFDTAAEGGNGTVGGPHQVRINAPGFRYESEEPLDLPKEESEESFDLSPDEVTVTPENTEEV